MVVPSRRTINPHPLPGADGGPHSFPCERSTDRSARAIHATETTLLDASRPVPGAYTARDRLLRVLRGQRTERVPICPVGLAPFTQHLDFPAYHPVIELWLKFGW
jgi:hypothetical protein